MWKKCKYLWSLSLLGILMGSCHNDVGEVNPATESEIQTTVPLNFMEGEGNLAGLVLDQSNNPVPNAAVSIYSGSTITNEYGVFSFRDASVDPQGTFVKVEKSGYLLGSDLVYPNDDGNGTAHVKLLKEVNVPAFDASEGGTVAIDGGGSITFVASSLIRINGSIYDGEVRATAYRLSALDDELGQQMAGGLLGYDTSGRHRALSTFGIIVVELRGFDNQKLRLKSDQVAQLTLPLESELHGAIEGDVAIWSFDSADGLWHEYTNANFSNSNFTASINTLGYWNVASSHAVSQVCGRLLYNNELPAKSYTIEILNNGLPSRIGVTDQDGYFCGKVPYGESLTMRVIHPLCGQVIKTQAIGQFEEVGTIGDVKIEANEKYITGSIECSGEPASNTTIIVESNDQFRVFYPNSDGAFEINLDEILCNANDGYRLFAYDNGSASKSEVFDLSADFSESLRLDVCDIDCAASAVFIYDRDDYCTDGEYANVTVEISGGSGNYMYEWMDGSTEATTANFSSGQEIAVKVIDLNTDCTYDFTDVVTAYQRLKIKALSTANTACQMNSGFTDLAYLGGRGPFEFEWTGPNGFMSSKEQIDNLVPGSYTVIIRDANDCEVTASTEVYDVTTPIESSVDALCDMSVITIIESEGYQPYTYTWSAGEAIDNQLFVSSPGNYKLTVTDANACTRTTSLTISMAGTLPAIDPTYTCELDQAIFSNLISGFEYFYQPDGSSEKTFVDLNQGKVEVPILESGYRFQIGSENNDFSECSVSELIELPRFNGLSVVEVNSVSCESCQDGSIVYEVNMTADCVDCTVGSVIVIRKEDKMDVTALNDAAELDKGEYYVVAIDSGAECYIAHSLVTID